MHWENSCFVNIGSLCSLAQQSLLCIKHLRTEVLNNIFIFPVDVSSLFWDNSLVLVLLSSSDCTFPFVNDKDATGSGEESEGLPLGLSCWGSPVSGEWPGLRHSGIARWSEQRHLVLWPDREPRG